MNFRRIKRVLLWSLAGLVWGVTALALSQPATAQTVPFVEVRSSYDFQDTLSKLQSATRRNKIGIVTRASAQQGAASLGVKIPGNQVWGLFAPRFAVRMLKASVSAGFEAPLRLYIVEAADGGVTVRYRTPSVVFRPYNNPDLDAMAKELDALFENIVGAVR